MAKLRTRTNNKCADLQVAVDGRLGLTGPNGLFDRINYRNMNHFVGTLMPLVPRPRGIVMLEGGLPNKT